MMDLIKDNLWFFCSGIFTVELIVFLLLSWVASYLFVLMFGSWLGQRSDFVQYLVFLICSCVMLVYLLNGTYQGSFKHDGAFKSPAYYQALKISHLLVWSILSSVIYFGFFKLKKARKDRV